MIQCPYCKSSIPSDSAFCDQCGEKLTLCSHCGVPVKAKVCTQCGTPLSAIKKLFLNCDRFAGEKEIISGKIFGRNDPPMDNKKEFDTISAQHAHFHFREGNWFIEDIGSTNGTLVNNQYIHPEQAIRLQQNDQLTMGEVIFTVIIK